MADFSDFGLLVGKHTTALPSLTTEQFSTLQLDSSGRLIIAGRFIEDAAHTSGDSGISILAVRRDADTSLVDSDGDYSPLQVDENGRLKVAADLEISNSSEKEEDAAHVSGDIGSFVLAVRQDTLASSTSTDGDYAAFKANSLGELYVHDTDVKTELVAANASLDAIEVDIAAIEVDVAAIEVDIAAIEVELLDQGTTLDAIETELLDQGTTLDSIETEIQSITHAEDSAHSSGHVGVMSLAVRNDSLTSLVDTSGDYASLQLDSLGRLKVISYEATFGTEAYTVSDALAAAGDGLITITAAATPWVTVASLAVGAGVTAYVYGYQWACDQNAQARIVTDDTTDVIVYKTSLNSSSEPGNSEHFSENGRIEIPGAASLEVKLQIKKRSTTGGNALGTGSLHIRTV